MRTVASLPYEITREDHVWIPMSDGVRLSISSSYWPPAWPPPEPAMVTVHTGQSTLSLPVRPVAAPDEVSARPFDA